MREDVREVGHDRDGGAIYESSATGERWNAGDDHDCKSPDSGREATNG